MNRRLRTFLRRAGATSEELERAQREGWLTLLTVDRLLVPGAPRYTVAETAQRAGVDEVVGRRVWRALGFPDLPADAPVLSDRDVEALRLLRARTEEGLFISVDAVAEQVRTVSASLARIAEVESDVMRARITAARDAGLTDEQTAVMLLDSIDWDTLEQLLDYAHRLQLRAALWRRLGPGHPEGTEVLAVGFADLVGYTALSQELEDDALAALVSQFERLAYDTVAVRGGRVVKTIGDEVMFVADDCGAAARIALDIREEAGGNPQVPPARVGLAYGSVVARAGDYFGPVVNLASRLTEVARPGSVLVAPEVHDALADDPDLAWSRPRTRRIRDIGKVELYALRWSDAHLGHQAGNSRRGR